MLFTWKKHTRGVNTATIKGIRATKCVTFQMPRKRSVCLCGIDCNYSKFYLYHLFSHRLVWLCQDVNSSETISRFTQAYQDSHTSASHLTLNCNIYHLPHNLHQNKHLHDKIVKYNFKDVYASRSTYMYTSRL